VETIIVDNCSEIPVKTILPNSPFIIVRNEKNLGAVGRNKGIEIARGSIIVTLDDDVYGLSDQHLAYLQEMLRQQPDLAAINFRIEEEGTGRLTDWCHPCDPVMGAEREMETNDISEGAVAFRRAALEQVGLYPESFFISHEGPDLAFRLINAGWRIIYSPRVKVIHGYEQTARVSWRRYYYDTRNQLWFVLRNLSFWYGLKRLMTGWGAMMVYSVRDGYSRYWFRAVWHALLGARREWQQRTPPVPGIERRWKEIERDKPGFWVMVRKRLFNREVRI
jgi:GT2 family glycosyltransferase